MVFAPEDRVYLGIMTGPHDPSAAIVRNGQVLALVDEERFVRDKHAFGRFPLQSIRYCLNEAGVGLDEVHQIATPWDLDAHSDGSMSEFYAGLESRWPVDAATLAWQRRQLETFSALALQQRYLRELRQEFGVVAIPPIVGPGHHYSHAFQAAHEGPFEDALVVVLDGSGDRHSGTVWSKRAESLSLMREVLLPHSVGWFFAAMTEYLGFAASDGEYKVMGLAAFGTPNAELRALVDEVLLVDDDGIGYRLNPVFIHYGKHTYSGRFTDALVEHFGRLPRTRVDAVEDWHKDLAFAAQSAVEDAVVRLVGWGVEASGIHAVCLGGGVAMNVKVNSRIAALDGVDAVFAHPACADNGAAAGAALAACHADIGVVPGALHSVALGPIYGNEAVAAELAAVGAPTELSNNVVVEIAHELAAGKVVGWFSGRMEAGSRALGHRSILADPRHTDMRDRVNDVIKHREPWRPFAPSIPLELVENFSGDVGDSRFMTIAFRANDRLRAEAPAVVHVDGTSRIHGVERTENPDYHRLISEFGKLTGVPILLNTSFNMAGEPIVCTPADALRTFWSSGLDVLVLGDYVLRKSTQSVGSYRHREDLGNG